MMIKKYTWTFLFSFLAFMSGTAQTKLSINSASVDYAPVISNDGQSLVFQSNRSKGFRLYESIKKDSVWGEPKAIDPINNTAADLALIGSPYFSAGGDTLFYSAVFAEGAGDLDLYYSIRKKDSWSKPEHLPMTINSKLPETSPSINASGDTLFFIRKGTEAANPACGKVFFSVKENNNWKEAALLPVTANSCFNRLQQTYVSGYYWNEANSKQQLLETANPAVKKARALNDFIPANGRTTWITPKEDQLVYASNGDLYTTSLAYNTHIKGTSFIGKVKESEKNTPMAAVRLLITDIEHKETKVLTSSSTGEYTLYVPSGNTYQLTIIAEKYDTLIKTYTVASGDWFTIKNEDLVLQRRKKKMVFNVSDNDNGKNLKVKVKVTNKTTGEELILDENMQQDGRYTIHLREGDDYSVEVNNLEGYAFTKRDFNSSDENTADISIPVSKIKTGTSLEIHDIFFDFNSYKLNPDSFKELDDLAQWMKTNKTVGVQIEAHTDDVGSEEFNRTLSEKRAKEIVAYLSKKGITASRMKAKGYGKNKPRAEGDSEEARAKNRRVELTITSLGKQ